MSNRTLQVVVAGALAAAIGTLSASSANAGEQRAVLWCGTCVSMKTPFGPGSLKPIKRPA